MSIIFREVAALAVTVVNSFEILSPTVYRELNRHEFQRISKEIVSKSVNK